MVLNKVKNTRLHCQTYNVVHVGYIGRAKKQERGVTDEFVYILARGFLRRLSTRKKYGSHVYGSSYVTISYAHVP